MTAPISGFQGFNGPQGLRLDIAGENARSMFKTDPDGPSFADSLNQLVDNVEQTQGAANTAVVDMLEGQGEVHDAMIAMQRAEMTLQLTVQVRNKLMQAYQDIMRMPM